METRMMTDSASDGYTKTHKHTADYTIFRNCMINEKDISFENVLWEVNWLFVDSKSQEYTPY